MRALPAARPGALMLSSRLIISSTAQPFSASAPVGQTCTHLPQLVQLLRLAPGLVQLAHQPRAGCRATLTSHTCAPSTSAQTRTQRVHRMQRL